MPGGLSVRNLTKQFAGPQGGGHLAVSDVSFDVADGEFFTMLGPSGCGKTTTLRMIAGLETATAGRVTIAGRDATGVPARLRNIGMVFQSYALFPHLSVFENVAYGLRIRRVAQAEIRARVAECLDLLALAPLAERLPGMLSGGQQQRVSIARALVYRPPVLLLDEPLANLDAKLRVQMRDEILRVQRSLGVMVLYVTHDQEEAMAVSDRIAVFDRGRVAQIGAPAEIYDRPQSLFVADFIGKANFLPVATAGLGEGRCRLASGVVVEAGRSVSLAAEDAAALPPDAEALLMVRPERLRPVAEGPLVARIDRVQHLGPLMRAVVAIAEAPGEFLVDLPSGLAAMPKAGETCRLDFAAADATLFRRAA
jgi:ABC-type Fe3+/spermidine/putrescine transport system ATPase subunit